MFQEGACLLKTGFVVDEVSEESFYQNLLLGLTKTLEQAPCVSNISLKHFRGAREVDIRSWEHNNGVLLPEDAKNFYASTNGFLYTYTFSYASTNEQTAAHVGKIEINPLENLVRTYGYETKNVAEIDKLGTKYKLSLSRDSKVFELSKVCENSKVVLVYINSYSIPTIWLFTCPLVFHYLADSLTTYFRMCIAHLGIPSWQLVASSEGVPEQSKEIFQIIAPGLLQDDRNLINVPKFEYDEFNKIDVSIFVMPQQQTDVINHSEAASTTAPLALPSKKKSKRTVKQSGTKTRKNNLM